MSTLMVKGARVVVTAIVTVELDSYGPEWTIQSATENAEGCAINRLRAALKEHSNMFVGDNITCTRVVIDA